MKELFALLVIAIFFLAGMAILVAILKAMGA